MAHGRHLENIVNAITCLPKFRPHRFTVRRVMAFPIFSNMAVVSHLEF